MTPEELARRQAEAIAQVGDRTLEPHPDGLMGRALDAQAEAEGAVAYAKLMRELALGEDEDAGG